MLPQAKPALCLEKNKRNSNQQSRESRDGVACHINAESHFTGVTFINRINRQVILISITAQVTCFNGKHNAQLENLKVFVFYPLNPADTCWTLVNGAATLFLINGLKSQDKNHNVTSEKEKDP